MTELTLDATVENLPKVISFVEAQLERLDCPIKSQMQIAIALDELFSNIAHYAYQPGVGPVTIRLAFVQDSRTVVITFMDSGVPYNPLESKEPDITLSAEDRSIGGLGIYMAKKSMDNMAYQYENGQNILTIRKRI